MTRKHFEALATALASVRPTEPVDPDNDEWDWSAQLEQWTTDVRRVASVCARFNPSFDRERFILACTTR